MGKNKTADKSKVRGPYLSAALFCDNLLQGEDKAISAIRIVDKVNLTLPADAPPDVPSEKNPLPVVVWTLVAFKSVDAPGEHTVKLVINSPSGKSKDGLTRTMNFSEEPSGGANLKVHLGLAVHVPGLYLIDVVLDGRVMTRMPLAINIKREEPAPEAQQASSPSPKKDAKSNGKSKRGAARAKK